jgi:selenide, water dikinase
VLIGGGHSHVQVLRAFAMRPVPGVRLTLISREAYTPYSGMLPGHVAGDYDWRDIHIDLGPLTRYAGARFMPAEMTALDATARRVEFVDRPPLRYDLLSLNTGAQPAMTAAGGIPVKPIGRFLPRWAEACASARPGDRFVLVGGGAGGVELALAARKALPAGVDLTLLTDDLLPDQSGRARRLLDRALAAAGVRLERGFQVTGTEPAGTGVAVVARDGRRLAADQLFWVTGVAPPGWVADSGLATDSDGFVRVDRHLRSISHAEVFAAGDLAALDGQRRPKSGVFAVREGPVLADNLRRALLGRRLRRYRAQRRFLTLIGTADGRAVASRGAWSAQGRWVWRWKQRIDRRFMRRFNDLPVMEEPPNPLPAPLRDRHLEGMRCGGCGAKLGADPLRRVLARLPDQSELERRHQVRLGIGDDAAALRLDGELLVTVDGFRSVVDDAYRFGRITAHHCLNDVLAMGGHAVAALAHATVPLMAAAMMEEELYQLLGGAVAVLNDHGVPLVGGHTSEGAELALSLTLAGTADGAPLGKGGLLPGDALVINKPIGTGVVLAADRQQKATSAQVGAALAVMDQSNAPALTVLRSHGARALTDVTGFGLIGHLGEMLNASACGVDLYPDRVPLLPGAEALMDAGVASSLQVDNELALAAFGVEPGANQAARIRLLADPQTAGGLLAGVPGDCAEACVAALRSAGYPQAAVIARVTDGSWRTVTA